MHGFSACALYGDGSDVTARIDERIVHYKLHVPGRHWIQSTLAVLASIHALDGDMDIAAEALGSLTAPKGRGARYQMQLQDGAFTVIDESYNASPASMRAAIAVLAASQPKFRRSQGLRFSVTCSNWVTPRPSFTPRLPVISKPQRSILSFVPDPTCTRSTMRFPQSMRSAYAETSESLTAAVLDEVHAGDVVMVKGSLGSRMAVIVDALSGMDISNAIAREAQHAV